MPLDPEVLAAIQESVKTSLTESFTNIETKIEANRRELLKNQETTKKEITNLFDTELTKRLEPFAENIKFIEGVKAEYEKELQEQQKNKENETPEESEKTGKRSKKSVVDESAIEQRLKAEFEARLAEDRKKVTELENQLKADQEKAREEQEKARTSSLRNEALNKIRELNLVSPGKENRLFALLEQDGKLIKTEEGYKISSKDKFGDDVQVDIPEILPELIKTSYDEYSIPRGGTGTGGQQGSRSPATPTRDFSGMSAQQIYDQKLSLGDDLIKTLEQTYSG